MNQIVEDILAHFRARGGSLYGGENVTQLEHALQSATFARAAGASHALVTAALLHDIGHLLHALPENAPDHGVDDLHENLAATYLNQFFGADVVEAARLHVEAKRYLCSVDSSYLDLLSKPSLLSLVMQGGPMSTEEVTAFEALPYALDAVQLRRWDDQAKDPEMVTQPIEAFADSIAASLRAS